jgi:hypothetical protein
VAPTDILPVEVYNKFFDQGLLAIYAAVVSFLYYRGTQEIKALNLLLIDQVQVVTKVLTENSAALTAVASAQEKASASDRELAEAIRLSLTRDRGGAR